MKLKDVLKYAIFWNKGYGIPLFQSKALNRKIDSVADKLKKQKTKKRYSRKNVQKEYMGN